MRGPLKSLYEIAKSQVLLISLPESATEPFAVSHYSYKKVRFVQFLGAVHIADLVQCTADQPQARMAYYLQLPVSGELRPSLRGLAY